MAIMRWWLLVAAAVVGYCFTLGNAIGSRFAAIQPEKRQPRQFSEARKGDEYRII